MSPRRLLAVALVLVLAGSARGAPADPDELTGPPPGPPVPIVTLDALPLSIPMADLAPPSRALAEGVMARSVLAQRVEGIRFPSREAVYRFLLDHPDFAASVARALKLGEYHVLPLNEGYWGDDSRGATGLIRILYADEGRRLFYLEGKYQQRFLPTIEGRILILLEFRHEVDEQGDTVVEQVLTGHVRLDTPLAGMVAQVVGSLARSLVERAVEQKVRRFFNTVARVSRWAHVEPEQLAAALDGNPEVEMGPSLAAFRAILLDGRPPAWAHAPFRLVSDSLRLDDSGLD